MGNFYSNIILISDDESAVIDRLNKSKTTTYVYHETPYVCVFPKHDDLLFSIAHGLSKDLNCIAFAVINHDDSLLQYQLFSSGQQMDDYNSCPGYFTGQEQPPIGGDAAVLADSFGKGAATKVLDEILRKSYTFELNRHDALCAKLEFPYCTVGGGFGYIVDGDAPEDLVAEKLTQTYPNGAEDDSDFAFKGKANYIPGVGIVQDSESYEGEASALRESSLDKQFDADKIMDEALKRAQIGADAFVKEFSSMQIMGTSGDGAIKIQSQGKFQIGKVEIEAAVVDVENVELLESLVLEALNDVSTQTKQKLLEIKNRVHTPKFGPGQLKNLDG